MLVLNPRAGNGKGLKVFSAIRELLERRIPNLDIKVSEYSGELTILA